MPDPKTVVVWDALAAYLDAQLSPLFDDLQVVGRMQLSPTPPSIDFVFDDPAYEDSGFGDDVDMLLVVRARVAPLDHEGAQELLLSLMDPWATTSLRRTLEANRTLTGVVQDLVCAHPSAFGRYIEPDGTSLFGCQWDVRLTIKAPS